MVISLLIPNMNRTYNLRQTLPHTIDAANASPPCEIVILNYSSTDDLDCYMQTVRDTENLAEGNSITYATLPGQKYYNSPHARNLCVLAARGQYIVMLDTELILTHGFVQAIRSMIEKENPVWMCEGKMGRLIVCQREEFLDAGGYDERFKFYAPEDKDICQRLHRRKGKFLTFSHSLYSQIYTPYQEKIKNLDLRIFEGRQQVKADMSHLMIPIYERNNLEGVLQANPNGWGAGYETMTIQSIPSMSPSETIKS